MDEKNQPSTSSDLGGAPGGLGASTGADPRGPAAGMQHPQPAESRSFAHTRPGHTPPVGEGGGAMSGRGQEHGADSGPHGQEAHDPAMRDLAEPGPGVSGGGTDETSGTGDNAMGGTGASASGDAHLGHDGRRLGDPMNAARQVHSDDSGDIANGSGAD